MDKITQTEMPVEVTLRDMPDSAMVETKIHQRAEKLQEFFKRIEFCKVVIEPYQKHKHQGKLYTALVEIGVPGKRIVANHKVEENVYILIRESFSAVERQLEEYVRKNRGE